MNRTTPLKLTASKSRGCYGMSVHIVDSDEPDGRFMNISVVIPVFNDTSALPELLQRLFKMADAERYTTELIIVDDGSESETWEQIRKIRKAYSARDITQIRLAYNHGQYAATLCGLLRCKHDFLVTLDADLQHPPESIPVLLEKLVSGDFELVYGKSLTGHNWARRAISTTRRLLASPIGSSLFHASSFRALRKPLISKLLDQVTEQIFSLDECLSRIVTSAGNIPINHQKRKYRKSSYTPKKLAGIALKSAYHSAHLKRGSIVLGASFIILGLLCMASDHVSLPFFVGSVVIFSGIAVTATGLHITRNRKKLPLQEQFEIAEIES